MHLQGCVCKWVTFRLYCCRACFFHCTWAVMVMDTCLVYPVWTLTGWGNVNTCVPDSSLQTCCFLVFTPKESRPAVWRRWGCSSASKRGPFLPRLGWVDVKSQCLRAYVHPECFLFCFSFFFLFPGFNNLIYWKRTAENKSKTKASFSVASFEETKTSNKMFRLNLSVFGMKSVEFAGLKKKVCVWVFVLYSIFCLKYFFKK